MRISNKIATDGLIVQGDTRFDLAEVLELAGRRHQATTVMHEALDRYERKEALVLAHRVRERIASLQEAPR